MNLIVCLDERDGMLFLGRRQSQDRVLRSHMLEFAEGNGLWMNAYSARQFEPGAPITVDEEFLRHAPEDAWCFAENTDLMPHIAKIRKLAIYRWNRHYPCDTYFPRAEFESRWTQVSTGEFPGSSHDLITQEVYTL